MVIDQKFGGWHVKLMKQVPAPEFLVYDRPIAYEIRRCARLSGEEETYETVTSVIRRGLDAVHRSVCAIRDCLGNRPGSVGRRVARRSSDRNEYRNFFDSISRDERARDLRGPAVTDRKL